MAEEEGAAVAAVIPRADLDEHEKETDRMDETAPVGPSISHQKTAEGLSDLCLFVAKYPTTSQTTATVTRSPP